MAVAAIDKSLLKDRAYSQIKASIQRDEFSPGEFLSERQLVGWLGMSKTPIRAALERLEAEGFVAVSPQQGIVVRDLSVHEIADQFEIRLALESFVLRSIAGRLSSDQAAQIRKLLQAQAKAVRVGDLTAAAQLDADFHAAFCAFHGNAEILRVMLQQRERMHRVVVRVFENRRERLQSSYEEHRVIARAVLEGNARRAVSALKEHLNYGRQLLLSPRQ